ncbi:MAG TPA: hypothetical protein VMJ94_02815, partial [Nitrososphaera sp.]|nr:hypothetical protein [Nitrososphaera sp.]
IRLLLLAALAVAAAQANLAYGDFFGATQDIDGYQVVFAPYPSNPVAGSNSTLLNFSVLGDGDNIYNIHSAVVVTDRQSGDIVGQVPYRLYEFSDIKIPYTFNDNGRYVVTLQTRIIGDDKYQVDPLVASFDISVGNQFIPFDELMLLYVTPAAVAIAGITIYLHEKKRSSYSALVLES